MSLRTNNIVLITDEGYVLPTSVCIKSIASNYINNDNDILQINVCTFNLSKESVIYLKSFSTEFTKINIIFINEEAFKDRMRQVVVKSHVSKAALIKFELANIFTHLNSVLYLDGDIIIKDNINEILNTDIEDNYLAAVHEYWEHLNHIRFKLFTKEKEIFYFNSGVMLLNLKKIRKDNIINKLWDYKIHNAKTTLMDQETLNAVFGSKVFRLPIIWNFNPLFYKEGNIPEINKIYGLNYKSIYNLLENTKIIHYVGKADKPWVYSNASLRNYWDYYYELIPNKKDVHLRPFEAKRSNIIFSLSNKLNSYGILGVISYFVYLIKRRYFSVKLK